MDPRPLLAYHAWLGLPQETRSKLTQLFHIPRTGESIVTTGMLPNGTIGGVVQQDGHSASDLYAITVEKMQEVLNNPDEKDFHILFNGVVENLDAILGIVPEPISSEDVISAPTPETVATTNEPSFVPRDPEELLKNLPTVEPIAIELEGEPLDIQSVEIIETNTEDNAKVETPAKKGRPAKAK